MDSALAWVGWIAEWLGKWIPRIEIIPTTHKGVKFRRGNEVHALEPGLHIYWPLITEFRVYATARQAVDLRPQVLTLKDGTTVLIGALITYEIDDIEKALARTWDVEESVRDSALSAITEVCLPLSWSELKELAHSNKLNIKLRASARPVLAEYGVKVLKLTLTDLAITFVAKLVQSTNTI